MHAHAHSHATEHHHLAPSKTLASLLEEGEAILARREADRRREKATEEAKQQQEWLALREQARHDFGELAESIPAVPPARFDRHYSWAVELMPFAGGASIFVTYQPESDSIDGQGSPSWSRSAIRVQTRFRVEADSANPTSLTVECVEWEEPETIAEALALCQRASEGSHREAQIECYQVSMRPRPPQPKREPEVVLTTAERGLVLALRRLLACERGD